MFNLLLSRITTYLTPIVGVVGFLLGLWFSHLYHSAVEAHQTKVLLAQVEKQKELDNKVITSLQSDNASLQKSYITLGEKVHETKLATTSCPITTDGVKLWNQSNSPETSLPSDTKGITDTSNTASGITIEDLYANKLENDKICNGLRDQLEAIIQWNHDTYGE